MSVDPERLQESELSSFGYVIRLGAPGQVERKQFLLRLLAQVSRLDAQWGSALRESAVETLANLTESYTFAEIDFVLRRAFLRSSSSEGGRDPVALHHFEKILADTPPQAVQIFDQVAAAGVTSGDVSFGDAAPAAGQDTLKKKAEEKEKKKPKGDSKDPMESIFGWCNFWLPDSMHLPPVVWAMIFFGILAHLMARTTYQPYNRRDRRAKGGPGGSRSLFSDMPAGAGGQFGSDFESLLGGLGSMSGGMSGSMSGNMPGMPGMPGMSGMP
ncbi:unnamed protein product, partial [Polarella glacialis]